MRSTLLAAVWILGALAASAEEPAFVSGRPGKNESPIVVPAGYLQLETEIVRSGRDREDGATTRALSVAASSLRFGLGRGYEAELIVQPRLSTKTAGEARLSGPGDLDLRLRKNLAGEDGGAWAAALIPYVRAPTSRAGLGNERWGGGLLLPVQAQASDRAGFSATLGLAVDDSARPSRSAVSGSLAAGLSYAFTDRLGGFAEAYAARPFEGGGRTESTFDVGATWLATKTLQFDVGLNVGLSRAAEDLELYTGIARRF